MDRRDYILRMIEQLGQALAALRRRILARGVDDAEVRESLSKIARDGGLDFELARAMTADTLLMMVAPGGEVDPSRCWLLAELFDLEGTDADLADDPEAARSAWERAGFLYGMLQPVPGNPIGITEARERVASIERKLETLPPRRARHSRLPRSSLRTAAAVRPGRKRVF
jgi:hypothetical protein